MTTSQIAPDVYQAARETAVLTDRSDLGTLIFSGETRFDLINRMSTQKVLAMPKGTASVAAIRRAPVAAKVRLIRPSAM